jgi:hypothetical protein
MNIPERIQRKRTKGYKQPENTCYCGRGSKWGNPFIVGEEININVSGIKISTKITLKNCLNLYDRYLDYQIKNNQLDLTELLKYDYLSCWCPLDKSCHLDILISKLKELTKK